MEINERASTSIDCPVSPTTETGGTTAAGDEINRRACEASDRLNAYLQGQLQGTIDDYKLLENMNNTTTQRYSDMQSVADTISTRLALLQNKYDEMRPLLEQIDEIDEASRRLEAAVGTLETFISALEAKLRKYQQQ